LAYLSFRSVVAVIRHGDRTPKQKMKMEVRHPKFFELFDKYAGNKKGHVKLKKPRQLQEILDIVRELYDEKSNDTVESEMIQEKKSKLMQMKTVLEMHDFSGINRKVQLKKGVSSKASAETGSEAEDGGKSFLLCLFIN
jgi:inositol hexakisphosphate/diphosphoinositol-pentakisphosphate kinase